MSIKKDLQSTLKEILAIYAGKIRFLLAVPFMILSYILDTLGDYTAKFAEWVEGAEEDDEDDEEWDETFNV